MAYWHQSGHEPVRTAVVGLGYWGPNLVRNLHELPGADLVAVCDLRPEALERISRRYPGVATSASFQAILDHESVEAICIATPVATHHPLALQALAAGKHVFIEKPMAASAEQAVDLVASAEAAGRILMPGHTFLYSPPVNTIRELIASGELGDIYFISTSRVNLGLHQPDASVVWDLAPHDFSILRYWLEETPVAVSAISRGCVIPSTPDVAFINLEYGSGIVAHAELSWLSPSKLRRTTVVGSQKMVVYDDTSNEPVRVFDSGVTLPDPQTFGEYRLTYRTGDIVSKHVAPEEPLLLELSDFCSAIRTGSTPRSNADVGVDVVRMMEAVDCSLATGGRPASIANDPTMV